MATLGLLARSVEPLAVEALPQDELASTPFVVWVVLRHLGLQPEHFAPSSVHDALQHGIRVGPGRYGLGNYFMTRRGFAMAW